MANQAYVYGPPTGAADSNLALESENFLDTTRWKPITATYQLTATTSGVGVKAGETVRTASGDWYRANSDATISVGESFGGSGWTQLTAMKSDRGQQFAFQLNGKFYVVKPIDMAMPTLVYANVANQLFSDRAKIVGWMESHAGNAEAIARYQALLEQIDAKLLKMGLAVQTGNTGGVVAPRAQFDMLFLRLPTVQASGGGIYVQADGVSGDSLALAYGSGRALAHGQARINIVNNTPFSLEINDVGVLPSGRVDKLDGQLVSLAAGSVYFGNRPITQAVVAIASSVVTLNQSFLKPEAGQTVAVSSNSTRGFATLVGTEAISLRATPRSGASLPANATDLLAAIVSARLETPL